MMNVTLEWFLNHIFSNSEGEVPLVWIYEHCNNFFPDDEESLGSTCLIALYKSDFVAKYSLNREICDTVVREIHWTDKGIVLTVSDAEELSNDEF